MKNIETIKIKDKFFCMPLILELIEFDRIDIDRMSMIFPFIPSNFVNKSWTSANNNQEGMFFNRTNL